MFKKSLLVLSLITLSGTALSTSLVASLKATESIAPPSYTISDNSDKTEDPLRYNVNIYRGIFLVSNDLKPRALNHKILKWCVMQ